jgi:hypothetical protein
MIKTEQKLDELPKSDLIWMVELMRTQRDALSAENIALRNKISDYQTRFTAIKNLAKGFETE